MKMARNHPLLEDWKKVTCCTRWTHDLWHHQPFVQVISAALQQWPCVRATLFYALPVFVYVAKGSLNQPNTLVLNRSIYRSIYPSNLKKQDQIKSEVLMVWFSLIHLSLGLQPSLQSTCHVCYLFCHMAVMPAGENFLTPSPRNVCTLERLWERQGLGGERECFIV